MKNKLKFLIKESLNKKINTKWFKIVNILLLILLIAGMNIDSIISFFGGDFEEKRQILVIDNSNTYDLFSENFKLLSSNIESFGEFALSRETKPIKELKDSLNKENNAIIIEIVKDDYEYLKANMTSYEPVDTITSQIILQALSAVKSNYALENSNISEEELIRITSPISISTEITNPNLNENAEARDIVSAGAIVIFLVPFFILVVLLTQMIGAEINDEKTTRGMEIIISNVPPKIHFFSKIVASLSFVIMQSILLLAYVVIGILIKKVIGSNLNGTSALTKAITELINTLKNTGMLSDLIKALPILIIIFLSSFLAYALLAGILASMTTNTEDYQQLQTPLMIICAAGYYIAMMAPMFDGSVFIKILSYIPFMSALISPIIYLLGQTTMIDLLISALSLIVTCYLLFKYGIRIYKVGILNYSSKDLWKKVFKSLKQNN